MNTTPDICNETPEQAARRFAVGLFSQGYELDELHAYQDASGNALYWRIRLKHPDTGDKKIWPMHIDQQNRYILKEPNFVDKKLLYKLPNILKSCDVANPVYIAEGEKCVDVLTKLGVVATTSGGNTSAASADWSPLRNRDVIIWPDNDKEGQRYAEDVAKLLLPLGCKVKLIDIQKLDLPLKGDVIDWMKVNPSVSGKDIQCLPLVDLRSVDSATDDEVVDVLAQLSEIVYQRQRKDAAKSLNIPVTLLDKLVKQKRMEYVDEAESIFPLIEPCEDDVILGDLLDEIAKTLNDYLVFSSHHDAMAIALWIVHTHCIDAAKVTPILNINSPEKRCGKSTLLSVLQRLVNKPLIASNISAAAVYRSIEKWAPTLLIDEGDTFMRENEELRGIINSGHTRDLAYTLRCVGDKHEPTRFCTWGAKAIAGIGRQADTIEDRSVCIRLRRKLPHEARKRLRDAPDDLFIKLLRQCARIAVDNISVLTAARPSIPNELNDRAADNWQPLLAIAELAGDTWFKLARECALSLSNVEASSSISVELLQDIKWVLEQRRVERIWTTELLQALYHISEAPWGTYNHGKPLTDRQLANKLSDFSIKSKDIRFSDKVRKGYELEDFEDSFHRYLPKSKENEYSSATALQDSNDGLSALVNEGNISELSRSQIAIEAPSDMGCSGVANESSNLAMASEE